MSRVTTILEWPWIDHVYRPVNGKCLICGCDQREYHQDTIAKNKAEHDHNVKKSGYPLFFSRYGQCDR